MQRETGYWNKVRRLTLWLLLAWFATTVLSIWFARELSHINLFGWPLPFYMAAQGSLLIYLGIIGLYAWRVHRLERRLRQDRHGH
jgi:putative solute:sodium symporter small subunit